MTIVPLKNPVLDDIALVRLAADELRENLVYLRRNVERALDGVQKARTIDKVVLRYAVWLGTWHSCNLGLTFSLHCGVGITGQHAVAFLQVKSSISSIRDMIDERAHWISVPNLDRTRLNIQSVLIRTIRAIDDAIAGSDVLAGHQSTKGTAA